MNENQEPAPSPAVSAESEHFILWFEDHDCPPMHFSIREIAQKAYDQHSVGYTCHLFERIDSARAIARATIERLTAENAMYSLDVKKCRAMAMRFTEDPSEIVSSLIERTENAEKDQKQLREELRTARVDQYELVASREKLKEAQETIARLEAALALESADREADRKELESDYAALKRENARLESELASGGHSVRMSTATVAEMAALRADKQRLESELAEAKASAKRFDDNTSAAIRLVNKKNDELEETKQKLTAVTKELSEVKAKTEPTDQHSYYRQCGELGEQLATTTARVERLAALVKTAFFEGRRQNKPFFIDDEKLEQDWKLSPISKALAEEKA